MNEHAAAVVVGVVAGDGAVAHRGPPLVQLYAAAVEAGEVILDGYALYQARVIAGHRVDVDAAAALVPVELAGRIVVEA